MEKTEFNPSQQLEPAPEHNVFDYAMAVAKAGSLVFPFFGAGITLLDLLSAPIRGKRMNDWCEGFRLGFNDLSQKVAGLTPERLAVDEAFVSAFAQATQAALKTHQKEKLDALKNAVFNVALGKQPDPNRQQQFLAMLDRFSETHLVVLKFLNDPKSHFEKLGRPVPYVDQRGPKLLVNNFIHDAMPAIRTSSAQEREGTSFQFVEMILGDLVATRLVTLERLNNTWAVPTPATVRPGGTPVQKMATHLGEDFFSFISRI